MQIKSFEKDTQEPRHQFCFYCCSFFNFLTAFSFTLFITSLHSREQVEIWGIISINSLYNGITLPPFRPSWENRIQYTELKPPSSARTEKSRKRNIFFLPPLLSYFLCVSFYLYLAMNFCCVSQRYFERFIFPCGQGLQGKNIKPVICSHKQWRDLILRLCGNKTRSSISSPQGIRFVCMWACAFHLARTFILPRISANAGVFSPTNVWPDGRF